MEQAVDAAPSPRKLHNAEEASVCWPPIKQYIFPPDPMGAEELALALHDHGAAGDNTLLSIKGFGELQQLGQRANSITNRNGDPEEKLSILGDRARVCSNRGECFQFPNPSRSRGGPRPVQCTGAAVLSTVPVPTPTRPEYGVAWRGVAIQVVDRGRHGTAALPAPWPCQARALQLWARGKKRKTRSRSRVTTGQKDETGRLPNSYIPCSKQAGIMLNHLGRVYKGVTAAHARTHAAGGRPRTRCGGGGSAGRAEDRCAPVTLPW